MTGWVSVPSEFGRLSISSDTMVVCEGFESIHL